MTASELESYRQTIVREFDEPLILNAEKDVTLLNAGNTGNRDAYGGKSWINYWRAITRNQDSILYCSSCEKVIFVGNLAQDQVRKYLPIGGKIEDHQAHGGHLWVIAPKGVTWQGGRYIAPLCPACNAKHNQHILIKAGSKLCKEVGAKVTEE